MSNLRSATYITSLHGLPYQLNIKQGKVYSVVSMLPFLSRGSNFTGQHGCPVLSFHFFQNHSALFTATKTCYLRFISFIYFLFWFYFIFTIQQALFGRDIWGRTVALIDEMCRQHQTIKTTENLL